jgi:uncharacterized repeat protein (TIGR01451 family)
MKLKILSIALIVLSIIIYSNQTFASSSCLSYNRDAAVNYAFNHTDNDSDRDEWNIKDYKAYDNDCTNFVSQCLVAGGLTDTFDKKMCTGPGVPCFDIDNLGAILACDGCVDDKGMIIRANPLPAILEKYFCAKVTGPLPRGSIPSNLKEGDVVVMAKTGFAQRTHAAIIVETGGTFETTKVAMHTTDAYGKSLEAIYEGGYYYFTYAHFPYDDDNKCWCFEKDPQTLECKKESKCDGCSSCDDTTGECKSWCEETPAGRCTPGSMCMCSYKNGKEYCGCWTLAGGDCPDDTLTVASAQQTGEAVYSSISSQVGVLDTGYTYDMQKLLSSFNEAVRTVSPSDISQTLAKETPLLIIPTAGLHGMEKSDFFKTSLDGYVNQGGSILVLSQQYGYEYSVLPGGLSGYGWAEDQSCQSNSSYIDTWHNVLAGQTKTTPSLNVDGYFTKYPDDTTVLLRRTANGQPAVLMYQYGNGYVIASTAYTDTANTRGEASEDEKRLVRDIVAWAKSPATLTEIKPGQTISLSISITNPSENRINATQVRVKIYDPDRKNIVYEMPVEVNLPPGETTSVSTSYTAGTNSSLGIYHTLYDLTGGGIWNYDDDDDPNTYQMVNWLIGDLTEPSSGRFVVSNPPSNPYKSSDFSFSVNSDSEYYAYGSTATFTFNLWNYTNTDRQIKVTWGLPHHGFGWDNYFNKTVTVAANDQASFAYTLENVRDLDRLRARFYDESGNQIGYAEKGIWMIYPSVNVTVQTDKTLYSRGESVNLTLNLQNKKSVSYTTTLKVRVSDPSNTNIYNTTSDVSLGANATLIQTLSFTLPSTAQGGYYIVSVEAYDTTDKKIGGDSTSFELPLSQISVTSNLPSTFTIGSNTIQFTLNNIGKINVSSGTLDISFKDPEGTIIYSGSQSFTLGTGQNTTLNFPITIPSLKFGNYTLTYTQSDETKTGKSNTITISNTVTIALSFDKSSYRIRETANATVDLTNTGKFDLNNVSVTVNSDSYTNTQNSSLLSANSSQLTYSIPIPETTTAGQHEVSVTLTLPSGSSTTSSSKFTIPESSLTISYSGSTNLTAGDTINLKIENTGGADASYTTEKLTITDNKGVVIYQGDPTDTVMAGEKKTLADIQIPSQTLDGKIHLYIRIKDNNSGVLSYFYQVFDITGVTASLQTITDKESYLKTEAITGLTSLTNGAFRTENGSLNIIVSKIKATSTDEFKHFLPLKGWTAFNLPRGVAIGSDGSVYVVDTNNLIQKFDSNGNFITKWGSYGSSDGQFKGPYGIAVGSDGLVYVADTYNHRVQKFDSNGNFITKWGSQGSGNGQFSYPNGIAIGPDGSVYVADTNNNRIQKFDSSGNFIAKWGSPGSSNGQFSYPIGIAIGIDGFVYLADTYNNRIQKFDSDGNFITTWGNYGGGNGQFNSPSGITVGTDGSVHVTDTYNHRIQKFDSNGNFITTWGSQGSGNGQFNYPYGIAVRSDGSVYVADTNNNRIQKFDSSGNFITKWSTSGSGDGQFYYPQGVAIDSNGSVYVTDTTNHRIQKFDSSGNFVTKWGSYGSSNGQFRYPDGIAIGSDGFVYVIDRSHIQKFDSNGNFIAKWGSIGHGDGQFDSPGGIAINSNGLYVYVTDRNKHRIQKFDSNGNFITKWGSYGSGNGQFYYPQGVAVATDGSVFVADNSNNRIQKFDSNGNFITKWGCPGPYGIAVGHDGSVYVVDIWNHRIQKFDSNGNFITKWGSYGSGNGQFYYPQGVAVAADGSVYVADTYNHRIQRMVVSSGGTETLFETTIPITQSANTTQDYTTSIGTLNTTGKLYLQAELKNSLGQTIATDEYPFYVVEGNTVLSFSADKKYYKPNETITITGKVENLSSITASALSLSISSQKSGDSNQNLYNATFDLSANGSRTFTVTTTASTEGTYTLTGKVTQSNSTLVEINDQYEVAQPKVSVSVSVSEVVGNEQFDINVEMKNEGKIDISTQLSAISSQGTTIDNQQITIPAGETKLLQYSQQITGDTTYTFTFTGDLEQTTTKQVLYGLSATIAFSDQQSAISSTYPEGNISIPVTITNTGQLDTTIDARFTMQDASNNTIQDTTKTYYVSKGTSTTDTLYYNLTEGSYQLSAVSSQPTASATASFSAQKENKVDMTVSVGLQTSELIPVTVNLTNNGYNDINGSIQLSALSNQGAVVWNGIQTVTQLLTLNSQLLTFNINPSAIQPGDYTLKAELFDNSNQQLATNSQTLTIEGATFQMTQLPSYQTFTVGQEVTFTFKVKNTGNQEGSVDLNLKAYDMIDSTQTEWLMPAEEKEISFSFTLPDDLEEKDYFADYEMKAVSGQQSAINGQVKYHVAGINLSVSASLNKQYYSEGDTAHLTIAVSSQQSAISQNLFARVNYNGYENQQSFTIASTSTLTFDIPLTEITGQKLFYGIYYESGRSIHLNSLYIYKAGDVITIITDKQVYKTGETVSVTVTSSTTGTMTLSGPNNYTETFEFTGSATKSFTLSSTMSAGTYYIKGELTVSNGNKYTEKHAIDIDGIQVKVLECKNDKGKYASSDTITTNLTISSNTTMTATLKAWIIDPEGKYTPTGETPVLLVSSEPLLFTSNFSLLTSVSGIHRFAYGIYTGDLLLASGSEAFDVGDAVLLGLSTDKTDYPENTETVNVTVSIYGTVDASLELQLDGSTVESESVSLDGFTTKAFSLQPSDVSPGTRTLKAILTAGGLTSTKETSFTYGSNLPDLVAEISYQQSAISKDNTIQITATVRNQGKTTSDATTISLYDGDPSTGSGLIETKSIGSLNSGGSEEITFTWNVLGKAGEHTIKAVVDPDNTVTEFNEENNESTLNVTVPDISLITETDKDTYKIRQKVNINSTITNLTASTTYQNLTITTTATDSSGKEVYNKSTVIEAIQPSSTITHTETWNTTGLTTDGIYTITQSVFREGDHEGSPYIQNSKLITLEMAPDFTIKTYNDYQKIKQGEKATYTAYLESSNGWNSDVTLSIEGLPPGASVSFDPGFLIPPGESTTVVITTNATTTGTHNLTLKAEGIDEGETVTHTLPLTLDVSGFELGAELTSQTIKQLETATFEINVNSLNGYEGEINLSIDGVPNGIKTSLGDSPDSTAFQAGKSGTVPITVQIPNSETIKLTVQTSKYVKPSTYTLTVTGDDGLVKHKLDLSLTININPDISAGIITAQGPGPKNQAQIKAFNSSLQTVLDITAFDTKYGANAIGADIDGDGYDEIIVAQGPDPKNTATLKAFKLNGTSIVEYTAFDTKYGLTLSSGDIDGDWKDELIVGMGPDPKNPATLKILKYNGSRFDEIMTQTVFDTKYGVNTATGDIDGDGIPEIITAHGPGPNNSATVIIWKYDSGILTKSSTITAFDGNYGTNITAGDIDGDGNAEIITGTGPDPKNNAVVRAYKADGTLIMELSPYDSKYGYGVTVASGDINGDGIDDIITGLGPGPQNPSWVKVFKSDGTEIYSFISYSNDVKYGVNVSKGNVGD